MITIDWYNCNGVQFAASLMALAHDTLNDKYSSADDLLPIATEVNQIMEETDIPSKYIYCPRCGVIGLRKDWKPDIKCVRCNAYPKVVGTTMDVTTHDVFRKERLFRSFGTMDARDKRLGILLRRF